ncbi:subclass B1 metallo-beta-lactamase [Mariniradius sediminis]|uniref:beta-lactamase n=1 Tax=Mariniradius sediminis TaxID=2909237 RepID=A0ABS9C0I9_9BACT|nr:subclass B1 metallo-beta-lactamase [Mariniradius sediminis]MCF1753065.1 subclass B1 metallo-beta-lactamase [Mariniradius sediminis]
MKPVPVLVLMFLFFYLNISAQAQQKSPFQAQEIYRSETLVLTQVSENTFIHTSFLQTDDFGKVPCNGLVVTVGKEALVFDTPTDVAVSEELIQWITKNQKLEIKGIVPTHFHNDCLGGLQAFEEMEIPSYATFKTIELAKANNYVVPKNGFADSLVLKVGDRTVLVKHYGEGHTKDNVVAYFPSERVLFGGCLVKEVDATRGYLGDANLDTWSGTVEAVKKGFPETKIVVPGHGKHGGVELLDYTIKLFQTRHFGERNGNEVK